jgi:hypothetical protein
MKRLDAIIKKNTRDLQVGHGMEHGVRVCLPGNFREPVRLAPCLDLSPSVLPRIPFSTIGTWVLQCCFLCKRSRARSLWTKQACLAKQTRALPSDLLWGLNGGVLRSGGGRTPKYSCGFPAAPAKRLSISTLVASLHTMTDAIPQKGDESHRSREHAILWVEISIECD